MTQARKLKQEIRARALKTGERYSAARRQVLLARQKKRPPVSPTPSAKPIAGEASVVKKTGHGYDHWFAVLDAFGAPAKGHRASAAHLHDDHGLPGWHSQMITVSYERVRGLRKTNQSCAGDFQVSASKAVPVSVARVVECLTTSKRAEWLKDPALAGLLDSANVSLKGDASARLRFRWDGSVVEIRITAKRGGATVVADNSKLSDPSLVEKRRQVWRSTLEVLKEYVSG